MNGMDCSHSSALPDRLRGNHQAPPVSTPSRKGKAPIDPLSESPVRSATNLPLRSCPAATHQPGSDTPPAAFARRRRASGADRSILLIAWLATYTAAIAAVPGLTAAG